MHQRRRRPRRSASRRQPSYLGRVTLAVALLVAAAGAIGYGIAGDGLHPERWLGAAAVVCGAGMVVGAWRGRALWLVLPGLLFAGSGFVAGHAARAGLDDFAVGGRDFWTDSPTDGLPAREDLVAGQITVTIDDAPPPNTRSDLRVGVGVIEVVVDDDVALEVRAHVHDGHIVVNGDETPNDGDPVVLHFGPDRTARRDHQRDGEHRRAADQPPRSRDAFGSTRGAGDHSGAGGASRTRGGSGNRCHGQGLKMPAHRFKPLSALIGIVVIALGAGVAAVRLRRDRQRPGDLGRRGDRRARRIRPPGDPDAREGTARRLGTRTSCRPGPVAVSTTLIRWSRPRAGRSEEDG